MISLAKQLAPADSKRKIYQTTYGQNSQKQTPVCSPKQLKIGPEKKPLRLEHIKISMNSKENCFICEKVQANSKKKGPEDIRTTFYCKLCQKHVHRMCWDKHISKK
jgi:hypothetical protein